MKSAGLAILLTLLSSGFATYAEELIVGINTVGNPPLTFAQGHPKPGIYKEILQAISANKGIEVSYRYLPPKRLLFAFDKGEVHIEPGINPAWRAQAKQPGLYTVAFATNENIVLFAPGQKVIVRTPMDLLGREVGTIRGYFYPGYMELFEQNRIVRRDGNSEYNLMNRMASGRFKQIFIQKDVAMYWMAHETRFKSFEIGNVNFKDPIMFRVHPTKRHLLDTLNQNIEQMLATGKIEAIYQKYR